MADANVFNDPTIEFEAVVVRCGCGDPDSHNGKHGESRPCPKPRAVQDLGVTDTTREE